MDIKGVSGVATIYIKWYNNVAQHEVPCPAEDGSGPCFDSDFTRMV
ncbi:hypothetical protein HMPREF0080_01442 [Anaeroglobus geminatus F0357]|uniref:Uncharacterized protein n=1 Tax=Anaeroglobus geminatus F0357 TaxID=861450 RepID=G9YIF0_9FIRM|nr:hypothetical protein HMPREF0080_01442 [Anaeroglobus geminatus F0357]